MPAAPESPAERYAAACRDGVLAYQWDPAAQAPVFPPRLVAPRTGSTELEWRESAGRGTVYSVTWIRPRDGEAYNVALIDLDEGFRVMSRVDADAVAIGMAVRVRFDDAVPVFEAAP
jgi:uncharacterized OB-fold protein